MEWPKDDMHYTRECKHYEHPIPSREYLLSHISKQYSQGASMDDLLNDFDVDNEDLVDAYYTRINAMLRHAQLKENHQGLLIPHPQLRHAEGRIQAKRGKLFIASEAFRKPPILPKRHCHNLQDGDVVEFYWRESTRHPRAIDIWITHLLSRAAQLEDMETRQTIINCVAEQHEIPREWPENLPQQPKALHHDHLDKTNLAFVTIDGETSQDFDDAVYAEQQQEHRFRLWVAIADVGAYVAPDSPLDKEAALRGNSVYFPGFVIPMLPENLSNDLCSLKPHVERLTWIAEMDIDHGQVQQAKFYPAHIESKARLTYTQVEHFLQNAGEKIDPTLHPSLRALDALAKDFRCTREKRGALDFERQEVGFDFNASGKVSGIKRLKHLWSHSLIEECMIAANVSAARWLTESGYAIPHRIHPAPEKTQIDELKVFLQPFGLQLPKEFNPKSLSTLLLQTKDLPNSDTLHLQILRTLSQARYHAKPDQHFGLALTHYAHFTSPIRRYADLLLHRALRACYHNQPLDNDTLDAQCEHLSQTDRRAEEAGRDVYAHLKCQWMQQYLGQTFCARIISTTTFGIFVEIDDYPVEGLVHITQLPNDYYDFDEASRQLIGRRAGRVFSMGDRLRVQLVKVDTLKKQIDFIWVGDVG